MIHAIVEQRSQHFDQIVRKVNLRLFHHPKQFAIHLTKHSHSFVKLLRFFRVQTFGHLNANTLWPQGQSTYKIIARPLLRLRCPLVSLPRTTFTLSYLMLTILVVLQVHLRHLGGWLRLVEYLLTLVGSRAAPNLIIEDQLPLSVL